MTLLIMSNSRKKTKRWEAGPRDIIFPKVFLHGDFPCDAESISKVFNSIMLWPGFDGPLWWTYFDGKNMDSLCYVYEWGKHVIRISDSEVSVFWFLFQGRLSFQKPETWLKDPHPLYSRHEVVHSFRSTAEKYERYVKLTAHVSSYTWRFWVPNGDIICLTC